jgi:hypothetical protein
VCGTCTCAGACACACVGAWRGAGASDGACSGVISSQGLCAHATRCSCRTLLMPHITCCISRITSHTLSHCMPYILCHRLDCTHYALHAIAHYMPHATRHTHCMHTSKCHTLLYAAHCTASPLKGNGHNHMHSPLTGHRLTGKWSVPSFANVTGCRSGIGTTAACCTRRAVTSYRCIDLLVD